MMTLLEVSGGGYASAAQSRGSVVDRPWIRKETALTAVIKLLDM